MIGKKCSRETLEAYLSGSLDGRATLEFELHACACPECERALWSALRPFEEQARESISLSSVPEGLLGRIKSRVARGGFVVESTTGAVVANGDPVAQGEKLPMVSRVISVGRNVLRLKGLRLIPRDAWCEFWLARRGGIWIIQPIAGTLDCVSGAMSPAYLVRAAGRDFVPHGTRFGVCPDGEAACLQVFESQVEVHAGADTTVVSAGRQTGNPHFPFVVDDPTALVGREPRLVPKLSEALKKEGGRSQEVLLTPQTLELVLGEQTECRLRPADASPYIRIAQAFTAQQDRLAAAVALKRALKLDANLVGIGQGLLWPAIRGQASVDGDRALAARLLEIVANRKPREKAYFQAWRGLLGALVETASTHELTRPRDLEAVAVHAERLSAFGKPQDRLCVGSALLEAGLLLRYNTAMLAAAEEVLLRTAEGSGGRAAAQAWQLLAEAQYFQKKEPESIDALRRAVRLWPKATWKVNLATRIAETGAPGPEEYRMLAEGTLQNPSAFAYERVLKFLLMVAETQADLEQFADLTRWVGDTFKSVPYVTSMAATMLTTLDLECADRFMRQTVDLHGGDPRRLAEYVKVTWARIQWLIHTSTKARRPSQNGRLEGACPVDQTNLTPLDLAFECGLASLGTGGVEYTRHACDFFHSIGDFPEAENALSACVWGSPNEEFFTRGKIAAALGKRKAALEWFDRCLAAGIPDVDARMAADAAVSRTELLAQCDPTAGRREAERLLMAGFPQLHETWRNSMKLWLPFEARLMMILGRTGEARRLLQEFIGGRGWMERQSVAGLLEALGFSWRS
jgi:tetratricopeptide (TPR) repeat protein